MDQGRCCCDLHLLPVSGVFCISTGMLDAATCFITEFCASAPECGFPGLNIV